MNIFTSRKTSSTLTEAPRSRAIGAVLLLAALLVSLLALPNVAEAQESGDVTVAGRGWLYASGTGDVDIDMGGRLRLHVEGDVTVIDNAGDMRVRLRGASDTTDQERTVNVTLTDFRGFVNVRGTDYTVMVDGKVVVNAHGRGQASLIGDGVYKTRHGELTSWDGLAQFGWPEMEADA